MPEDSSQSDHPDRQSELERASREAEGTFVGEFLAFLKENKKWWMAPIILVFGLLMLLAILSSSAAAPFIYSLF